MLGASLYSCPTAILERTSQGETLGNESLHRLSLAPAGAEGLTGCQKIAPCPQKKPETDFTTPRPFNGTTYLFRKRVTVR